MKKIVAAQAEAKEEARQQRRQSSVQNLTLKTPEEKAALVQIAPVTANPARVQESISREAMIGRPMQCDNCYVQDRCGFFQEGKSCYFVLTNTFSSTADLVSAVRVVLIAQTNRVTQALYQEQLDGGVLDRNLSFEMERLTAMVYEFNEFMAPKTEELEIKAKGGAVSAILAALGPRKRTPKQSLTVDVQPVTSE
jgi:hypothetical protein